MASDLPLSILIVGVGGADFKEMEVYAFLFVWFVLDWVIPLTNVAISSIHFPHHLLNSILSFIYQILDADKGERLESSSGRVASRDIVQFVPFRDAQSKEQIY